MREHYARVFGDHSMGAASLKKERMGLKIERMRKRMQEMQQRCRDQIAKREYIERFQRENGIHARGVRGMCQMSQIELEVEMHRRLAKRIENRACLLI